MVTNSDESILDLHTTKMKSGDVRQNIDSSPKISLKRRKRR